MKIQESERKTIQQFEDLSAWQEAYRLALWVYQITKSFPREEQFGITSQLRRAAASVCANIAKGFGRFHYKERVKFYIDARGSIAEIQSFLLLSKGLTYIDAPTFSHGRDQSKKVNAILNGLIRATRARG